MNGWVISHRCRRCGGSKRRWRRWKFRWRRAELMVEGFSGESFPSWSFTVFMIACTHYRIPSTVRRFRIWCLFLVSRCFGFCLPSFVSSGGSNRWLHDVIVSLLERQFSALKYQHYRWIIHIVQQWVCVCVCDKITSRSFSSSSWRAFNHPITLWEL